MRHRAPRQHRRQHFVDQPRTMLGADGWKIAPGFAPADLAVAVLDTDEHCGAVLHLAERGDYRRFQRVAVTEGLDAADDEGRGHKRSTLGLNAKRRNGILHPAPAFALSQS